MQTRVLRSAVLHTNYELMCCCQNGTGVKNPACNTLMLSTLIFIAIEIGLAALGSIKVAAADCEVRAKGYQLGIRCGNGNGSSDNAEVSFGIYNKNKSYSILVIESFAPDHTVSQSHKLKTEACFCTGSKFRGLRLSPIEATSPVLNILPDHHIHSLCDTVSSRYNAASTVPIIIPREFPLISIAPQLGRRSILGTAKMTLMHAAQLNIMATPGAAKGSVQIIFAAPDAIFRKA